MARKSAKRIVLDELAHLHAAALRAYNECNGCTETTPAAYFNMVDKFARKVTHKRDEAARIAELLGATTDEILTAYSDGETIFRSQK